MKLVVIYISLVSYIFTSTGMARLERAPRDFGDLHATINTTLLIMLNYSRTARIEHALTNLKFAILPLNYIPYPFTQMGFGKSIYRPFTFD